MAPQEAQVDPMEGRVARWRDIRANGVPVMFIDSVLPGNYRMNYAVIGDTASENPDFKPAITAPHKFQIGMFEAPPGNGPGWHTHEYVELFMPLTGQWTFSYGTNPDDPDDLTGQLVLDPWDVISFPPGLWRRFENSSEANAVGFAVLDPHEVFVDRDPIWPQWLVEKAAAAGLRADASGRMVVPENLAELEARVNDAIGFDGRPA
jgi:mannose-6-phosphate isomerase-like protein (cupin superfamily)